MAEAQEIEAEIKRLSGMSPDGLMNAVVQYVTGGSKTGAPRDVQGAALLSPQMAPRTLDALELALKRVRSFMPRQEGESKNQQAARIAPFRAALQAATRPYEDVVDDLAHEEAKQLAALDDETFARRWTAFVRDQPVTGPVPRRVQALAFRSPRVASRAEAICRLMMEEPARFLPPAAAGESRKARDTRVKEFRDRVLTEARFLRYGIQFAEARHGRMPSEPNVRLRALRLLGQQHPEELSSLLRQVREELMEGKKQARRDARAVRRAAGQSAL
ncbi:hypothetical protein [Streptomyces stelliscabiei]|uniref:hypothetical protein n=1 Tax=Streptomyces stelliscabiei TaxID=146820 RepID=UPI0029A64B96|nr:hypothetical protein [Streptomyces stelliscabiei]MDX2557726.1 hypothetical protein [Streptomyces stelliscabiei]MDX2617432.1 hypothetical protein [Streptomyces stelliscabiei]MDX2641581.1 hypothetical protein [Streptomyces stelliscabiei]MDX2667544.1 hypothetical protein [Streptomyces stelliscabiei]MDX2715848.1 hypothetical protein [Streptomyces stelliscabiei]